MPSKGARSLASFSLRWASETCAAAVVRPAVRASLAARAHRHQVRRDGRTPYIAHPVRVTLTVACTFGFTDVEILSGLEEGDRVVISSIDQFRGADIVLISD